jgi:O-antigen/teichoic acid export membrane protein
MEFGKHIGKGLWGLADKGLPVIYGLGFVFLVIRVLPEEEFGNFVLVQEIFLVISGFAAAFALQPLLKYAAESPDGHLGVVGASLLLHLGFYAGASVILVLLAHPLSRALNAPATGSLIMYIPAMLAAAFVRNSTIVLLQARFRISEIFWTDAVHFLGAPVMVWLLSRAGRFDSAFDLIMISIVSLTASSLLGAVFARRYFTTMVRSTRGDFRKVWLYGKYALGSTVSYLVYTKADTFLLSGFTGPVQVAVYNSAKTFTRAFEMVTQVVQMFIVPASSRLSSRGEHRSLQALVEKGILFVTVGTIPFFLVFFFGSGLLVHVLYGGRYTEAVPLLRVFGLLAFVVPLLAVGSNLLLGLGEAKRGFMLGLHMLWISLAAYLFLIPLFGALGAALGMVIATAALAALTTWNINQLVPVSLRGVLARFQDIRTFARNRLVH